MGFAEEIKSIRHKCLLSQTDFAKAVGVSFSTVNRWERGKSKPNYKALKRIDEFCKSNAINIACSELVWEEK